MVKAVFFDLDGTLSVPCYMSEGRLVVGFTDEGWFNHCTTLREHAYDYCKVVKPVMRYAEKRHSEGAVLYVLTVAQTEGEILAKKRFVDDRFPGLFKEVISVAANADKIAHMLGYADYMSMDRSEIEIVEDTYPVILKANDNGFVATHVSEIVCEL